MRGTRRGMSMNIKPAVMALVVLLNPVGCATRTADAAEHQEAASQREPTDAGRGQLLYETACAGCHTEQAHWREQRLVRDWTSLIEQVTRWQRTTGQNWRAEEIEDVAAYLNDRYYRVPCPVRTCTIGDIGTTASSEAVAR